MDLILKEITGFSCKDKKIYVYSNDGRGLYFFENPNQNEITFNLISGNWKTKNNLTELKKPLVYIVPELHLPTIKRDLKKFVYEVKANPNKCTIDFSGKDAKVVIDFEINEQDIPHFVFVMFHESGHFYYGGGEPETKKYFDDEHYCDCYAAKNMLQRGFNPSQCLFAVEMCLSEAKSSRERKDRIFNFLKKVKVK